MLQMKEEKKPLHTISWCHAHLYVYVIWKGAGHCQSPWVLALTLCEIAAWHYLLHHSVQNI